jgi:hypothetical protein
MIHFAKRIGAISALAAVAVATSVFGQGNANFAGTYRCEAEGMGCAASGATFTVTQTGNALSVTNDKNAVGSGTATSDITISMGPPWNMLGVVHEPNTIDWSNGTRWRKQ